MSYHTHNLEDGDVFSGYPEPFLPQGHSRTTCPDCKTTLTGVGPPDRLLRYHQVLEHPDPCLLQAIAEVNSMGLGGGDLTVFDPEAVKKPALLGTRSGGPG